MAQTSGPFKVIEAGPENVSSLKTIHARAFHTLREYHRVCMPNTEAVREWWGKVQAANIENPKDHVIVAIDTKSDNNEVYGCLNLRRFEAGERGIGMWTENSLSEDHVKDMCQGFIDYMVEWREKMMLDRPHYLIEFFGVDHSIQRQGLGKMLLRRACEILDKEGLEGFVEAGSDASDFYPKFGFKVENHTVLPGPIPYDEYIMVRPPAKK